MIDCSATETGTIKQVFRNEVPILLCHRHTKRAWGKHIKTDPNVVSTEGIKLFIPLSQTKVIKEGSQTSVERIEKKARTEELSNTDYEQYFQLSMEKKRVEQKKLIKYQTKGKVQAKLKNEL
ncbi:hypothetical protein HPULCUR_003364 [Helicostylum pulchrum]|uniref:Uncharacterized protein n=1 Tax=Helicostylum pulchrum TaxID=562976 RepID=A0ABP9XTB9_9FUNG